MKNNVMNKRIYYHDTDCGGVIYYANYLKYFEEGRTEYLRDRGIDLGELASQGLLFMVRATEVDYKSPAYYDDSISVHTEMREFRRVSIVFFQEAKKGDNSLVCAKTTLVCVNKDLRPASLPAVIKTALSQK
jgi:acyl-CoA thioester hydrolase